MKIIIFVILFLCHGCSANTTNTIATLEMTPQVAEFKFTEDPKPVKATCECSNKNPTGLLGALGLLFNLFSDCK